MAFQESSLSSTNEQDQLIEVTDLTKRFGRVTAVEGISFSVLQGELFGYLGPNGAGKTTTINMLTGLGQIRVP